MKLTIQTSLKEATLHRRLQQVFGTDEYISKVGANIVEFTSLGSCNNLAVRKKEPGLYELWIRNKVYPSFAIYTPTVVTALIEDLL